MKNLPSQKAAVLIETAIIFPFFMFGVLFFIWIGLTLNGKSSLTTAGSRAIRLALTRADRNATQGVAPIQELDDWIDSNGFNQGPRIERFFAQGVNFDEALDYYRQKSIGTVFQGSGGRDLYQMPLQYSYALAYFYEYLKQSVGPTLKYPCDPYSESAADSYGSGCVSCIFVNPEENNITEPFSGQIPDDRMGFECSYQPSTFLLTPITNLLGYMTGGAHVPRLVFSRKFFLIK